MPQGIRIIRKNERKTFNLVTMSCPDCFKGSVHDGEPRGKIIKLHDLDTYVVEPAEGKEVKGILVVIPDAFGWKFVNCRLLADNYANKSNYKVYMPDVMIGEHYPRFLFRLLTWQGMLLPYLPLTECILPWPLEIGSGEGEYGAYTPCT